MVLVIGCLLMAFSGALAVVPMLGLLAPIPAVVACVCVGRGVAAGGRAWLPGVAAVYLFVGAVHTAIATHRVVLHAQRAAFNQSANLPATPGPAPTYAGLRRAVPHWIVAPTLVVAVAFVGVRDRMRWRYCARVWCLLLAIFPLTVAWVHLLPWIGLPLTA